MILLAGILNFVAAFMVFIIDLLVIYGLMAHGGPGAPRRPA
jgi:hypothetical protein